MIENPFTCVSILSQFLIEETNRQTILPHTTIVDRKKVVNQLT